VHTLDDVSPEDAQIDPIGQVVDDDRPVVEQNDPTGQDIMLEEPCGQ
jgi:hypothetical protein